MISGRWKEWSWIRSWPADDPPRGRVGVDDDLPKLPVRGFDHRPLLRWTDGLIGVFLLEWDLAISPEDAARFEEIVLGSPSQIHVAPYRLYGYLESRWAHWHGDGMTRQEWGGEGDIWCDGFGLGCTYLPKALLRNWERDSPSDLALTDSSLSHWCIANKIKAVVDWDVKPIHLHWSWRVPPSVNGHPSSALALSEA